MQSWTQEHLISKRAKFISPNQLDCEGEVVEANKIIIAAGSRPIVPKIFEDAKEFLLTTDQIFEQENLPERNMQRWR